MDRNINNLELVHTNPDIKCMRSLSVEAAGYLSTTPSSSSFSDDLDKQTILNLTPELLLPATPARNTSKFFVRLNGVDPIKFSPPDSTPTYHRAATRKSAAMPEMQLTYSNFANSNPFSSDERYTQMRDFEDAQALRVDNADFKRNSTDMVAFPDEQVFKDGAISYEEEHTQIGDFHDAPAIREHTASHGKKYGHRLPRSPGMPHSQSEGNIDFRATVRDDHSIRVGKKFAVGCDPNRSSEDTSATSSSFSRGRSFSRAASPIKLLEDINENEAIPSPPKRSRSPMKQLFGEHGWLGKSMSMKELPSREYRKGGIRQWGGKLKERVEHLTEDVSKFVPTTVNHHRSPSKSPVKSKFSVSLSPPLQAKLYSEIELMVCATANQYLTIQQEESRMTVESLKKVMDFWASKNRPQVIEYMFDQATQRDLVLYNLKTFRFYGAHSENVIALNTMMQSWKVLAREMSVRTFCAPDSMIKKHMSDCYKILEMLGAPLVTFLAFQEIQVKALKIMREEQERQRRYESIKFGVERRWEPSKQTTIAFEGLENPFA